MRVVILAGGLGTRLAEETETRPKPMVEIGGRPILWHILRHYAAFGHDEFVVALGYRGEVVKRWFLERMSLSGSMTIDLDAHTVERHDGATEGWLVHLLDTGQDTNTGGRIRRCAPHLAGEPFLLTYGDGVSDVDLDEVLAFHRRCGRLATVTAVRPPARFGGLLFDGDLVSEFTEKPQIGEGWINGGFFVLEPAVLDLIEGDHTNFEHDVLAPLAKDGQLAAYRHEGFWQCMDTLRDKQYLESLWEAGSPPWTVQR
ncbi:glucose-1-phosphate cytidylyltransferase [Sporichthya polymorpha]|uniref:glucose-1-phosphate cytidylyltransferase n=1 Tax=Sporichthya polymorpha TaxID=35751 RepID=UPI000375E04F|nr:glucose-1-phosphate cytidylyltransferase [Sporichthya polymorpha]